MTEAQAEAAGQPVLEVEAAVAVAPTNLLLAGTECIAIVAAHSKAKADATPAPTKTADTTAVAPVPAPQPMEIESAAAEEPAAAEGGGGRKRRSERRPEDCPTQMTADSGRRVSEVIGRSAQSGCRKPVTFCIQMSSHSTISSSSDPSNVGLTARAFLGFATAGSSGSCVEGVSCSVLIVLGGGAESERERERENEFALSPHIYR